MSSCPSPVPWLTTSSTTAGSLSPIQPGFDGASITSVDNLCQYFTTLIKKFLMSNVYSSASRLKAPCPVTTYLCEKSLLLFLVGSLLFSRLRNPRLNNSNSSVCFHKRGAPVLKSFMWLLSGPALTDPCLSCARGPRTGHSIQVGVSQEQSRGIESPPSIAGHNPFYPVQ